MGDDQMLRLEQSPDAPVAAIKRNGENTLIVTDDEVVAVELDGESPDHSDVYLAHKLGKQVWFRVFSATAFANLALQSYQNYTTLHSENSGLDVFVQDSRQINSIYGSKNALGRAMKQVLLPSGYRHDSLSSSEQNNLRARGMRHMAMASKLFIVANVGRLVGNGATIFNCHDEGAECRAEEGAVAGIDIGTTVTWMLSSAFTQHGSSIIESATANGVMDSSIYNRAFVPFARGMQFIFIANVFQVLAGGTKMWIEIDNYSSNPEKANFSAFIDGSADAGRGAAYAVYNAYLIREASKVAGLGNHKKAWEILAVWSRPIPKPLLYSMRGLGMVGPAFSLATNVYTIYNGSTNEEINEDKNSNSIISGSLGAAASLAFVGSAYFITPASLPVGLILLVIGGSLLIAQTVYDEWDNIAIVLKNEKKHLSESQLQKTIKEFSQKFVGKL